MSKYYKALVAFVRFDYKLYSWIVSFIYFSNFQDIDDLNLVKSMWYFEISSVPL